MKRQSHNQGRDEGRQEEEVQKDGWMVNGRKKRREKWKGMKKKEGGWTSGLD